MRHQVHRDAVCPHYRHEDSQVVYCDGLTDGTVMHLAFANKTEAKSYKCDRCRDDYGSCPIYRMLKEVHRQ